MRYGIGPAFWGNTWDCNLEKYKRVAKKLADIGFSMYEISADNLYRMTDQEVLEMAAISKEYDLVLSTNSGPAKEYDFSSPDEAVRKNAMDYFKKIIRNMDIVKSPCLAGAIYSFWPTDFVLTDKKAAWERSIPMIGELGKYAEGFGIDIALEVLNRNETYILTDCKEALEYCERTGSKAVNVLLDTYHMNIEEDNMCDAIRLAGDRLKHFHVGENNRKLPGMNNSLNWDAIGQALRDINYDKGVVMEPFLHDGGAVGHDVRVWRDLSEGAAFNEEKLDELLKKSLTFLKSKCEG